MTRLESCAILASAGSGKTFALTTRYLALMLAGVAPERILAVTFTRAAAGEILDRLLKRLCEAGESESAAAALETQLRENDTVPVARLTAGRCRGALRGLVSAIDRLGVGTIDGFFARLAGAMMLDLDLAAGWRIAEDDEDARLRARAVEEVVESTDSEETVRLVRLLHGGMYSSRVFGAVLGAVGAAHAAYLQSEPGAWEEIGPLSEPLGEGALRAAVGALRALGLARNADGKTIDARWQKAHATAIERAAAADWDGFFDAGIAEAVGTGKADFAGKPIPDAVRAAYEPLLTHGRAVLVARLRDRNIATREALARFDAAYQRLKRATGVSTFDDVPRALVRAKVAGALERVYYALDGRLDHALIDEFQDTSVVQFGLLKPMMDEMAQDDSGARSLLCVGDVKQSIYRWRGAEPELLPAVLAEWESVRPKPLDKSRRSSPEIIEAVNAVFGSLRENPALAATAEGATAGGAWAGQFHAHCTAVKEPGFAQLRVTPGAADGCEHLEQSARHIAGLARGAQGASIGVLFPTWARMGWMLARLRGLGVDAVIEGGSGVADSPAVAAVLSLMRLADHPGNTATAFHVATSPLGAVVGLSWPPGGRVDEIGASLRRELAERGYAPTVAGWAAALAPECSARDAERLGRLVELAERFDAGAGGRPSEFASFAVSATSAEASEAQVRLLTVHRSKGLQFACVVLADLDGSILARPPGIVVERASPLAPVTAVTRYAAGHVRAGHPRLEAMHAASAARMIGESLSVLYVAMTRAERRLDVLLSPREGGENWPRTFGGLIHWALARDTARTPGAVLWARGAEVAAPEARPAARGAGERGMAGAGGGAAPITLGPPSGRITRASALAPSRIAEVRPRTIGEALAEGAPGALRDRGTLVHAWMESVEWVERVPSVEELRGVTERAGLAWSEEAGTLAERVRGVLRDALVRDLLDRGGASERWGRGAEVEAIRERPIAARGGGDESRVVVGRIDRLVLVREAGRLCGAEIIDFKTGEESGDNDAVVAWYGPQLRAYHGAVAAMYGLEAARVRCAVALVPQGRVVWVA